MTALVLDVETVATEAALAMPYPREKRNPPAHYKKEEVIAAWYEKDEAEWKAERVRECSLSPRLGRLVTIGWAMPDAGRHDVGIAFSADDEHLELCRAWERIAEASGRIITFNGLSFDVPFFLTRSLIHGIKPTVPVRTIRDWTRRYSYGPHYDVRAVLTQWDSRMSGTLSDYCTAFGIPCPTGSGSEVYAHYQAGEFDKIAEHCRSDVEATAALYQRISPIFGECS